jgi:hypothetical protein
MHKFDQNMLIIIVGLISDILCYFIVDLFGLLIIDDDDHIFLM